MGRNAPVRLAEDFLLGVAPLIHYKSVMKAVRLLPGVLGALGAVALPLAAQTPQTPPVVVTGEELPSAYGAPPGISRTRFSPSVTAYVLPPWCFYYGSIWQGDISGEPPFHQFTQEVEMGLSGRFGLAAETTFQRFNGGGDLRSISLEARYALADWNKIPLNQLFLLSISSAPAASSRARAARKRKTTWAMRTPW